MPRKKTSTRHSNQPKTAQTHSATSHAQTHSATSRTQTRPTTISRITRASIWQVTQLVLFLALPAVLFFSYHPVISLGNSATMNFELSLPLIWLVLFNLCSLVVFLQNRRRYKSLLPPLSQLKHAVLFRIALFAFPLYLTISCLWSANPLRGLLTVGIFWLILGAIAGSILLLYHTIREKSISFPAKLRIAISHPCRIFCKILLLAGLTVSVFCWIQCVLDLVGINRDYTLLCAGCTYQAFGFPHPSGFAIEPQFMGGLLLAPTLLALYLWHTRRGIRYFASAFFLSATLFLTFSRGAIYAFAIGLMFILIYLIVYSKRHHANTNESPHTKTSKLRSNADGTSRAPTKTASTRTGEPTSSPHPIRHLIIVPVMAFIFTLLMQGVFAMLSPTSDTFITGITKSIHHLSLGVIDLRPTIVREDPSNIDNYANLAPPLITTPHTSTVALITTSMASPAIIPAASPATFVATNNISIPTTPTPTILAATSDSTFDGYAAISTDTRLHLSDLALETWRSHPASTIFGTGLGSAGTVLYQHYPELGSPKEIVQNEYVSLLLETGISGYLTLIISCIALALLLRRLRGTSPSNPTNHTNLTTISSFSPLPHNSRPHFALPYAYWLALVLAYAVTICFFSGLPNALHIYLLTPLILILLRYHKNKDSDTIIP